MENLEDGDSENVSKSKETVMLMPEYLIVCCWRSVKEISLLLGQLTSDLPIVSAGTHQGLLTYEQVRLEIKIKTNIYIQTCLHSG
jgi:hypothetical protein